MGSVSNASNRCERREETANRTRSPQRYGNVRYKGRHDMKWGKKREEIIYVIIHIAFAAYADGYCTQEISLDVRIRLAHVQCSVHHIAFLLAYCVFSLSLSLDFKMQPHCNEKRAQNKNEKFKLQNRRNQIKNNKYLIWQMENMQTLPQTRRSGRPIEHSCFAFIFYARANFCWIMQSNRNGKRKIRSETAAAAAAHSPIQSYSAETETEIETK